MGGATQDKNNFKFLSSMYNYISINGSPNPKRLFRVSKWRTSFPRMGFVNTQISLVITRDSNNLYILESLVGTIYSFGDIEAILKSVPSEDGKTYCRVGNDVMISSVRSPRIYRMIPWFSFLLMIWNPRLVILPKIF